jgi:hypothetical protein
MMAEELNLNRETVRKILTGDFGMKLSAKWSQEFRVTSKSSVSL